MYLLNNDALARDVTVILVSYFFTYFAKECMQLTNDIMVIPCNKNDDIRPDFFDLFENVTGNRVLEDIAYIQKHSCSLQLRSSVVNTIF